MLERNNRIRIKKACSFCKEETNPDYKDVISLRRFITERGKIVNRLRSGVCYKHQRILSNAIKRSRYMALMPFSVAIR